MARSPGADDQPARAHRWPRSAAMVVLCLAVAALHSGLLGSLQAGLPSAGHGAAPATAAVPLVRALDVVAPRLAVRMVADASANVAAPLRAVAPAMAPPRTSPRDAAPMREPVDGAPRAVPLAPAATTTPSADTGAARNAAPAANLLPAPPREDAPMPADPPPVYATRTPAPATLRYTLHRGDARGEATLNWQPDSNAYELVLQATLPHGATLEQRSQGGFDDAGLAPLRLADRRRGRSAQAVNFQRPQGRITFSGPRWEYPLVPGVQDRLSWLVQLVAIASATALAPGDEVALQVVGARGATGRWRFRADNAGTAGAIYLVREPEHLHDLRLELWLDPARGHWPVRMRQAQVPGGEALEWVLEGGPAPPGGT